MLTFTKSDWLMLDFLPCLHDFGGLPVQLYYCHLSLEQWRNSLGNLGGADFGQYFLMIISLCLTYDYCTMNICIKFPN